jgi:endoribonuclease LACTB2
VAVYVARYVRFSSSLTEKQAPRLIRFSNAGTNTYLLGSGPSRILLDTAQGLPSWPPLLSQILKEQKAIVSICLLSHWHHDHVGGVKDLLEISPEVRIHKCTPSLNPDGILEVERIEDIKDGDTFGVDDGKTEFEVQALHCPGHTKDHMAFVVTRSSDEAEVGCMFTGDNVLGHGTAVFEDLTVYLKSLALMRERLREGKQAFPAHGEVIDNGKARVQGYLEHRNMREEEAMNVLRFGRTTRPSEGDLGNEATMGKEWGSMEMVKVIYADVPENLHEPAEGGLLMVLEKLRGEGRVVRTEGGMWKGSEKATL